MQRQGQQGAETLVGPALPMPGDAKAATTGSRDHSYGCTADVRGCKGRDNWAQRS